MRKVSAVKSITVFVVWVSSAIALLSCEQATLESVPPNAVVLAFGDSLTVGVGADASESYPSVLAQLCSCQVINAGVSGEVTADGVPRLARILTETRVDLLILLEGGNDILRNINPKTTEQNLRVMLETARRHKVAVVLLGVPEKKLFSNSAPFYESLAEQYDLVFEDKLIGELMRTSKYKSDPIHFNAAGYRNLAESLYALMVKRGAF